MGEILAHNREWIRRSWPRLAEALDRVSPAPVEVLANAPAPTLRVGGVQLTSARDRVGEAQRQARLVPPGATRAWVYGPALGDLPRVLLERAELEELTVVVFDPAVFGAALSFEEQEWLADPRVALSFASEEERVQAPFAVAPAELQLAHGPAAELRDSLRCLLDTPHVQRALGAQEETFAEHLRANASFLAEDADVSSLFGRARGETVHLAAAGPSLANHLDCLRQRRGPLIAVDGALAPLLQAGVVPELVVTLEANPLAQRFFPEDAGAREQLAGCGLVYSPIVPPERLERWPGERYVVLSAHPRFASLAAERPLAVLFSAGSVIHPALDLAVRLGARRVALYGADFAFTEGHTHAAGSAFDKPAEAWAGALTWVEDDDGERLPTLPNLIGYRRELEAFVERHPAVEFVKAGRQGARLAGVSLAPDGIPPDPGILHAH